jgi:hypothetical protein
MYLHKGKPIDIFSPLTLEDFQYPAGFFRDSEERALAGITYMDDPKPPKAAPGKKAVFREFVEENGEWRAVWDFVSLEAEEVQLIATNLEADRAQAVAKCYTDCDHVTVLAVGNRTVEYSEAEASARAYRAAGYTGTPDTDVSSYASYNFTGAVQSAKWAADMIIARADAFRVAQKSMRSTRFEYQNLLRATNTPEELAMVVKGWDDFIAATRKSLGL